MSSPSSAIFIGPRRMDKLSRNIFSTATVLQFVANSVRANFDSLGNFWKFSIQYFS